MRQATPERKARERYLQCFRILLTYNIKRTDKKPPLKQYLTDMKKLFIKFVGMLICFSLLNSCKNNSSNKTNESISDTADFKQLVADWNKAHSSKDVGVFSNLFKNSILYYGVQQDKNTCIESKLSLFKKYPDYYQQIFGDIQVEKINDNEVKCSFVKRVTVNQATTDYPSYLTFKKSTDSWKIVTEGDLVTDKNLANKAENITAIPEDAIEGDFNGDGKLDYMWLKAPKLKTEEMDCVGECTSFIKFSDPTIPSIEVPSCIGGYPSNAGDLNKNGTDEIGLLPEWFTSCWRTYFVWTFKNGAWINAVEPFHTHCNQWEEEIKPIEIDLNKEGNVIIRYSENTDEDIVTKSKSVKIAK